MARKLSPRRKIHNLPKIIKMVNDSLDYSSSDVLKTKFLSAVLPKELK